MGAAEDDDARPDLLQVRGGAARHGDCRIGRCADEAPGKRGVLFCQTLLSAVRRSRCRLRGGGSIFTGAGRACDGESFLHRNQQRQTPRTNNKLSHV